MESYLRDQFGKSGTSEVNLFQGDERLGISDNHRMAYYYFAKYGENNSHFIHVDSHADYEFICEDCLELLRVNPDILNCPENFINLNCADSKKKAVRWGNWIPSLREIYPELITSAHICLHNPVPLVQRDWPEAHFSTTPDNYRVIHPSSDSNTLYSFDIDYYFKRTGENYELRIGEQQAIEHFTQTLNIIKSTKNCLPFIALSPTCCGGWENTLPFTRIVDELYGTNVTNIINEHPR